MKKYFFIIFLLSSSMLFCDPGDHTIQGSHTLTQQSDMGITEAIDFAAKIAQLDDYSVDYVVPEVSPLIAILEQLPINIIKHEDNFWSSFAKRFEAAMGDLNTFSSPKATVTCSQCLIEIL